MMGATAQHIDKARDTTGVESLRISLEGPPEIVQRLLARLASGFEETAVAIQEPTRLREVGGEEFYSRADASARSGLSRERLSILVKSGELRNYGSKGNMRFSLSDIIEWRKTQR